jgi:hypothetical protein
LERLSWVEKRRSVTVSVPPNARQLLRRLVPRQQEEYAHPVEGLSDDWMTIGDK